MNRRYIDIRKSKEALIGGTSDKVRLSISLRDKDFKMLTGERIRITMRETDGSENHSSYTIPSSGVVHVDVTGAGQKQGTIYIKAAHDMGAEETITIKTVKVLGG